MHQTAYLPEPFTGHHRSWEGEFVKFRLSPVIAERTALDKSHIYQQSDESVHLAEGNVGPRGARRRRPPGTLVRVVDDRLDHGVG